MICKNPFTQGTSPDNITGENYPVFKKQIIPHVYKLFLENRKKTRKTQTYAASTILIPKMDINGSRKKVCTNRMYEHKCKTLTEILTV